MKRISGARTSVRQSHGILYIIPVTITIFHRAMVFSILAVLMDLMNHGPCQPRQMRVIFQPREPNQACTLLHLDVQYLALCYVLTSPCELRQVRALPHPTAQRLTLCYAMAPLGFGFTHGQFRQCLALQPRSPDFSRVTYFHRFIEPDFLTLSEQTCHDLY